MKIALPISSVLALLLTGCNSMPSSMNELGGSLNSGIKQVGNYLVTLDQNERASNGSTSTSKKGSTGLITAQQCQNSEGKTKSAVESMIGMSLTIDKAATVNSFSTVYNLSVSDMKNRYAPNTNAICSITFDGSKNNSKVIVWALM